MNGIFDNNADEILFHTIQQVTKELSRLGYFYVWDIIYHYIEANKVL